MSEDGFSRSELRERVMYAGLRGLARWARAARMPLKTTTRLLDVAYFHELRAAQLPIKRIAERLGVSPRRAALLSKALKDNFLKAERAHTLPRQVEFMLWAGPLGAARIRQALGDETRLEDVQAALDSLEAEGRVEKLEGRAAYQVTRANSRMVRDTWLARIDALDHLLQTVGDAVVGRFFENEAQAFARTVSLRIRPDDIAELRRLYEEVIWPRITELDAAAATDPAAQPLNLALLWAPRAYIDQLDQEDGS